MTALDRVWFVSAPAARLGAARAVLGGYTLWYLGRRVRMLRRIAATDPARFQPVGPARVLRRPLPVPVVHATTIATLAAAAAFTVGWRHPVSGPVFPALLTWTLAYRNSWSMVFHTDNALVLHALVLGLAPSADALSLDARAGRSGSPAGDPLVADPRYGWPLQLAQALSGAAYAVSGVAKLAGPLGYRWASGEHLRRQVAVDGIRKELGGEQVPPLAAALFPRPWVWRLAAVATLVVELAAPIVVGARRLRVPMAAALFGMHWGIRAVMGIRFRYQLSGAAFAPFLELERLPFVARLARANS